MCEKREGNGELVTRPLKCRKKQSIKFSFFSFVQLFAFYNIESFIAYKRLFRINLTLVYLLPFTLNFKVIYL